MDRLAELARQAEAAAVRAAAPRPCPPPGASHAAQTLVCLTVSLTRHAAAGELTPRAVRALVRTAPRPWRELLRESLRLCDDKLLEVEPQPSFWGDVCGKLGPAWRTDLLSASHAAVSSAGVDASDFGPRLFERFLRAFDRPTRGRLGVFFTPPALADFVVRQADELLESIFPGNGDGRGPSGLAAAASRSQLLPRSKKGGKESAGKSRRRDSLNSDSLNSDSLNSDGLNNDSLQPQPLGDPDRDRPFLQIIDPACGAGVFLVAAIGRIFARCQAAWAGDSFSQRAAAWNAYAAQLMPRLWGIDLLPAALALAQLNLAAALVRTGFDFAADVVWSLRQADALDYSLQASLPPATVILGNPPFSSDSPNRGRWIDKLLRGLDAGGASTSNYFQSQGQPLGERKTWLNDDYVKFIRWSQWRLEQSGGGVAALVTSHGYLDNLTFRGMRESLLESFSRIDVLDLHGSVKSRAGGAALRDENLFEVEQGTAVSLLGKPLLAAPTRCVRRAELRGDRASKQRRLDSPEQLDWRRLTPQPPLFLFAQEGTTHREYAAAAALDELMPRATTAPVTARDHFLIDASRGQLESRLAEFVDLSIDDDEIRRRHFKRTCSARHLAGDTWGGIPNAARRRLASADWRRDLTTCLYRPFDWRHILWRDDMVDWPRRAVTAHLGQRDNLCLIARRQSPPHSAAAFFWASDQIAIDGVIRSDNRGSESLFPLWLNESDGQGLGRAPNMAPEIAASFARQWGLKWQASPPAENSRPREALLGPLELFQYIYGLFHAPAFRTRYAASLRVGFPRIPCVKERRCFQRLQRIGARLLQLHLHPETLAPWPVEAASVPAAARPAYADGEIRLGKSVVARDIAASAWDFQVGSHQVLRKWLLDRRDAWADGETRVQYGRLIRAVERTLRWMRAADNALARAGGLPAAVHSRHAP